MSDTAIETKDKKEKKKWSRRKKIIVIILCVFLSLIILAVAGGLVALHKYCETPDFKVETISQSARDSGIKLIGHRGFRATEPENTAPAFVAAGKAHFYGAECDIYRTSDGVWVVQHDPYTFRMMDGNTNLEKHTYKELLKQNYDNGVNISKYKNLKITTLDEYLKICNSYGMTAVIELKGKNNTEHYDEVIATCAKYPKLNHVFISFHLENLKKIRSLTDAPCWYLVQEIDDEAIADAKSIGGSYGIDFNYAKEDNTDDVIKKLVATGMAVGAWTVDDANAAQHLNSLGVKYITTDSVRY